MPKKDLPDPTITLSKADTRRFLLVHQRLWPPRQLKGKAGIYNFIRHVGCIQFDPINVVGRNPDLVLQSRIANYRSRLLEEMLYTDRQLLDGWDKSASIFLTTDRPYFFPRPGTQILDCDEQVVIQEVRERGPLSTIDIRNDDRVVGNWGQPIRLVRATFERLYARGMLGIHHRIGSRRVFAPTERLFSPELLSTSNPNETDEDYQDWHVLRRVGGLGLAHSKASEYWLGMRGVTSHVRQSTLRRLVERGALIAVAVEDVPNQTFFIRTADLSTLEFVKTQKPSQPQAALIGALDNLTWDRSLLRWIFDFDYKWEVYTPAAKYKYGYYVLPVIYRDYFVARVDLAYDKKTRELTINNWWWEVGVKPEEMMQAVLIDCFQDFLNYLGATRIQLGQKVTGEKNLCWVARLNRRNKIIC